MYKPKSLQMLFIITPSFFLLLLNGCSGGGSLSTQSTLPPTTPSTPTDTPPAQVNDPGIIFNGTNLIVKTTVHNDLSNGSFGAAIRINNGVELFFYGTGAIAGEQEFIISKSDLELELGESINGAELKVRIGYSNNFPANTIVYTGATATLTN